MALNVRDERIVRRLYGGRAVGRPLEEELDLPVSDGARGGLIRQPVVEVPE